MNTISKILAFCLLLLPATASAVSPGGKALIIGIEAYEKANELRYVGNDVANLTEALSNRCGYDVTMIKDTAVEGFGQSISATTHRDAMMRRIGDWVASVRPTDNAVLFFSGHGFLGADNKLYLAVLDCDPSNPVPGGIPVDWLRDQLDSCQAASKVLLLDACHSGSAKGNQTRSVSAKAIAVEFAGAKNTTTLASCQGDESSYLWDLKKQSLFTFWLTQGIQGHADTDGDGEITLNELTDFVTVNVSNVADRMLEQQQNPIVIGDNQDSQSLTLVIKPALLKDLISAMADQLDTQLRCENLATVGIVPTFTSGEYENDLNLDFGTLPSYIASQLRNQLVTKGRGAYKIISENAMREALQRNGAGPGDIGASKTTTLVAKLSSEELLIPAVVSGRVRNREGSTIRLACTLVDAKGLSDIASAGGSAILSESERAMIPDSVSEIDRPQTVPTSNANPHSPPPLPTQQRISESNSDQSIEQAVEDVRQYDERAKKSHPLTDPNFPYRLQVMVKREDGKYDERPLRFEGNDCFVSLRKGDIYEVWVENGSEQPVWMRLMIDGLNTLAQNTNYTEKGMEVVATTATGVTVAPRVSLDEARAWHIEPRAKNAIQGFYEKEDKSRYEFKVVDSINLHVSRPSYTENIGLITAAFYREKLKESTFRPKGTRGIKTDLGKKIDATIQHYEGDTEVGQRLGVVHIRYGQ